MYEACIKLNEGRIRCLSMVKVMETLAVNAGKTIYVIADIGCRIKRVTGETMEPYLVDLAIQRGNAIGVLTTAVEGYDMI